MAIEATEELKTLQSLVSKKDRDNNSNSKPSHDLVERRSKRKASTDQAPSAKKLRTTHTSPHYRAEAEASVRAIKRKADADEESPKKRIRASNDKDITGSSSVLFVGVTEGKTLKKPSSDLILISSSSSSVSDDADVFDPSCFSVQTSRAEFEKTYVELMQIGKGGFGSVNAGSRKCDLAPVAIKHIPKTKVHYSEVTQNGKVINVIPEAALMVKAASGNESPGKSAVISLLSCFDLEDEVILVLERPQQAVDLHMYCKERGGCLEEDEARVIMRQVVDAAIQMHKNGVFHRDIKLDNILVETDSCVPRARVIDFGCGCLVKQGFYHSYCGTFAKAPPEWFFLREYQAGPATVWQLGALLYDLLDHQKHFRTEVYICEGMDFNSDLSIGCKNFLELCLAKDPKFRATLEQLKLHPWLI